jgi:deoxyuridine 5'-triphosphate nucleotidohydrolase
MSKINIQNNNGILSVCCEYESEPSNKIIKGANAIDYLFDGTHRLSILEERDVYSCTNILPFQYKLEHELAIPPKRTRPSDSGYDLWLIEKEKTFGNVTMYNTGVVVTPPSGYYFDMVPRSSIIKKGYMLANSVGIIDQGYTGEIKVPLMKTDPDAPELELPCKLVQLIPRKWYPFEPVPVEEIMSTNRQTGGFGSSD